MTTDPAPTTRPHADLIGFYGAPANRRAYLRDLFDGTAVDYDRILHYAFLGRGNAYRRRALSLSGLRPGMRLLDVACGTGAVAAEALRTLQPQQIVCVDPSAGMRAVARQKLGDGLAILDAHAEALPFASDTFDRLTMGYALRHVDSLEGAFREYFRVLKPGGAVLLLEISRPSGFLPRLLIRAYMGYGVPLLSRLIARSRRGHTLMRYFWESIDGCVAPAAILDALRNCGFTQVARRTEMGVFSAYSAAKPGPASAPEGRR